MRFITRICWLMLLIITGIIVAGFVTSNQGLITLHFWPGTIMLRAEIWVFVLSGFGFGVTTGAGVFWFQNLGLKARLWSKGKKITELEARIKETEKQFDDERLSEGYTQSAS